MKVLLMAALALFALTGCTAHATEVAVTPSITPIPLGSTAQQLTVDGTARDYRVFVPPGLAPDAPLVVMLHGGFGSALQAEKSYGWDAEARSQHFVVVYPNGVDHAWNVGGGCCGVPGRSGVDDVAFVSAVVANVEARVGIDHWRVYATGISNGGMMDYRLACNTTLFAAIGPDSATLLGDCGSPSPVSVIHIHGLADQNIPFAGGEGDGVAKINGPAVSSVIARFESADGCAPAIGSTSRSVTTAIASSCTTGKTVELVTIAGAGHQWPGSAPRPGLEKLLGTDPPSTALDATGTIWAFFVAHPG